MEAQAEEVVVEELGVVLDVVTAATTAAGMVGVTTGGRLRPRRDPVRDALRCLVPCADVPSAWFYFSSHFSRRSSWYPYSTRHAIRFRDRPLAAVRTALA